MDFTFMSNKKLNETTGVPITPPPDPTGIAIYEIPNPPFGSRIFVADEGNHRILNIKNEIPGSVVIIGGPDVFSSPKDVAVDTNTGDIYVADTGNHRVQKIDINGNFITKWGSLGSGNGQFNSPSGIAVALDHIFVSDRGNNRIQVFTKDGQFVKVMEPLVVEP